VIKAERVHDRCLQIVDVNRILDDVKTKVVRFANRHSRFDTTTGHPHRERLRMVISPLCTAQRGITFDHRSATKFPAPNDERFVQQARPFQIGN